MAAAAAPGRSPGAIVVDAGAGDDRVRGVVEGHDLYGVTAAACGEAVHRLMAAGPGRPAGALAPAEAFDPAGFLDALADYLSWRVER